MAKENQKLSDRSLDLIKRRSTLNLVVVSIAFAIALTSVYFTRIIVEQLKQRELGIIDLYAKSVEFTVNNQNNPSELAFVIEQIMYPNNSIPVIQTNGIGQVIDTKNIEIDQSLSNEQKDQYLKEILEEMKAEYEPLDELKQFYESCVVSEAYKILKDNSSLVPKNQIYYKRGLFERLPLYRVYQLMAMCNR